MKRKEMKKSVKRIIRTKGNVKDDKDEREVKGKYKRSEKGVRR